MLLLVFYVLMIEISISQDKSFSLHFKFQTLKTSIQNRVRITIDLSESALSCVLVWFRSKFLLQRLCCSVEAVQFFLGQVD